MEKNDRVWLIVVFLILLIMVIFSFKEFSGNVVSDSKDIKIEIYPKVIEFSDFDNSKAIKININAGGIKLNSNYVLKYLGDNQIIERGFLKCYDECSGDIDDVFILYKGIPSGEYRFVFNTICTGEYCNELESQTFEVKAV